jgi:hypothetical protein
LGETLFSSGQSVHDKSVYTQRLLHFNMKFLQILHCCLLPYGDSHIVAAFWLDHFLRS